MNLDQYRLIIRRRMNTFRAGWLFYLLLVGAVNIAGERITDHPAFSGLMGFVAGGLLVASSACQSFTGPSRTMLPCAACTMPSMTSACR